MKIQERSPQQAVALCDPNPPPLLDNEQPTLTTAWSGYDVHGLAKVADDHSHGDNACILRTAGGLRSANGHHGDTPADSGSRSRHRPCLPREPRTEALFTAGTSVSLTSSRRPSAVSLPRCPGPAGEHDALSGSSLDAFRLGRQTCPRFTVRAGRLCTFVKGERPGTELASRSSDRERPGENSGGLSQRTGRRSAAPGPGESKR